MKAHPHYIVFAGVNGAGKSTLFASRAWQDEALNFPMARVNPDEIAVRLGLDQTNEFDQLQAGKEAIRLANRYFAQKKSFNQETTLAGHSALMRMKKARTLGYRVIMFYVGLENAALAEERIAHRVAIGGHNIDAETVHKRFDASLTNFQKALDICDNVWVYDNTTSMTSLAGWEYGTLCWWNIEANKRICWLRGLMHSESWRDG